MRIIHILDRDDAPVSGGKQQGLIVGGNAFGVAEEDKKDDQNDCRDNKEEIGKDAGKGSREKNGEKQGKGRANKFAFTTLRKRDAQPHLRMNSITSAGGMFRHTLLMEQRSK
jgi:hypothetical protein